MKIVDRLKRTPAWFALPSIALVAAMGATMAGYSPLVFDPSLYQANSALANELASVDADELESKGSKSVGGAADAAELQDGTWTGYAACGQGNPDGWKPYYVAVTIEVKDKKVAGITSIAGSSSGNEGSTALSWDAAENQEYLDLAAQGRGGSGVKAQMEQQIADSGAVSGVDTVSGATYSSEAIYEAYTDAVRKASGQAGAVASVSDTSASAGESKKVSSSATSATLADGDWTGYAACGQGNERGWKPYYVQVTVKVSGGKVASVGGVKGSSTGNKGDAKLSWDASENQKYLSWAEGGRDGAAGVISQMNSQIASSGSVSGIDTVSGATYSSEAIYEAYADALDKSAKAAGSSTTTKKDTTKKKKKKSNGGTTSGGTVSNDTNVGALADGTWSAYAQCGPDPAETWKPYYVGVTLTVKDGKLVSLDKIFGSSTGESGSAKLNYDAAENAAYLDGAIELTGGKLKAAAASGTIPSTVDTVSGATYSSKAINEAFFAALKKSAAAGGATIAEPSQGGENNSPSESDTPDAGDSAGENDDSGKDSGSGDDSQTGDDSADNGSGDNPNPNADVVSAHYGYGFCQSAASDWDSYYIFVGVRAKGGKVTEITDAYGDAEGLVDSAVLYSASQNATYLDWAVSGKFGGAGYRMKSVVKQIQAKIDAGAADPTSGIQTVSGATRSSKAIVEAYKSAAANAAANLGATPEDAVAGN